VVEADSLVGGEVLAECLSLISRFILGYRGCFVYVSLGMKV
jgi:hypothetical protein